MSWLTLLTTLPPTPTRLHVGVWRKLQRMGAVRLRGSPWILPERPETTERFHWLVQEIQSFHDLGHHGEDCTFYMHFWATGDAGRLAPGAPGCA